MNLETMKKSFLALILFLSLTPLLAQGKFPSKPITLIVPYGSGGTDSQYRKLAELVGKDLGQPVVVLNQPGGSGTIAVTNMARTAAPDGYTIAASTGPILRQPHVMKSNFSPPKDLTWIAGLGGYTFILTVREDSPFKTLDDMISWARKNPGKLTFATIGTSSSSYVSMMLLARAAGIEVINVPYKGGSELQAAVLGGHVMVGGDSLLNIFPAKDGKHGIRALASFDAERSEYMPDLPTVKELGYDIVQDSPYGIVGPKGMPPAVVKTLQTAFERAAKSPENIAMLKTLRQRLWFRSSENYTEWAEKNFEIERKLVQELHLQ